MTDSQKDQMENYQFFAFANHIKNNNVDFLISIIEAEEKEIFKKEE